MGNRAIITDEAKKIAVYLHWNGGMGAILFGRRIPKDITRHAQSTRSIPMVNRWMIEGVSFVTSTEATAF